MPRQREANAFALGLCIAAWRHHLPRSARRGRRRGGRDGGVHLPRGREAEGICVGAGRGGEGCGAYLPRQVPGARVQVFAVGVRDAWADETWRRRTLSSCWRRWRRPSCSRCRPSRRLREECGAEWSTLYSAVVTRSRQLLSAVSAKQMALAVKYGVRETSKKYGVADTMATRSLPLTSTLASRWTVGRRADGCGAWCPCGCCLWEWELLGVGGASHGDSCCNKG